MEAHPINNLGIKKTHYHPGLVEEISGIMISQGDFIDVDGIKLKCYNSHTNCIGYVLQQLNIIQHKIANISSSFDLNQGFAPVDRMLQIHFKEQKAERYDVVDYRKIHDLSLDFIEGFDLKDDDIVAIRFQMNPINSDVYIFNHYVHMGIVLGGNIYHKPGETKVRVDSFSGFCDHMYDDIESKVKDGRDDYRVHSISTNLQYKVPCNKNDFKFGFVILRKNK